MFHRSAIIVQDVDAVRRLREAQQYTMDPVTEESLRRLVEDLGDEDDRVHQKQAAQATRLSGVRSVQNLLPVGDAAKPMGTARGMLAAQIVHSGALTKSVEDGNLLSNILDIMLNLPAVDHLEGIVRNKELALGTPLSPIRVGAELIPDVPHAAGEDGERGGDYGHRTEEATASR